MNDKTYDELLKNGLLGDHFSVLVKIRNKEKLIDNPRIQGFINLLTKKGYIDSEGELTEMGKRITEGHIEKVNFSTPEVTTKEEKKGNVSYEWCKELLRKCKDRVKELTGNTQFYLHVQGTPFPYLPGAVDLYTKITKFIKIYEFNDLDRIEKCILKHCESRNQKLLYYIVREKPELKSDLAADYENFEEKTTFRGGVDI